MTSQQDELRELRRTLGRFTTGVTVVTTPADGSVHAMTLNAFMSVSLQPPLIAVCVDKNAKMHDFIAASGLYAVSVLDQEAESLSQHFAGRPVPGMMPRFIWVDSFPMLEGAIAHFGTKVVDQHGVGDHTIFTGEIRHFSHSDDKPLIFADGRYRTLSDEAAVVS